MKARPEMAAMRSLLGLVALRASGATPTPEPGPGCVGTVPIANQSGVLPDCPHALVVHNASCSPRSGGGSATTHRPQFHTGSLCHGENDPNGPFYYNGVYHLFFQVRLPVAPV
jgi:hypothetical protein